MRHRESGRRLGRNSAHRKAMYRNMVSSLIEHGRILTRRMVPDRKLLTRLFREIAPVMMSRKGGYTRIIKAGNRRGDNAPMALIELIGIEKKAAAPVETQETEVKK